jgi:hypothetical protein
MGAGLGMGMGMAMANQMAQSGPWGARPQAAAAPAQQAPVQAAPPAPPPPPVEHVWHIAENGATKGPFSKAALGRMATAGEITRETYVWTAGQDGWKHAEDVAELAQLFTILPPPPPGAGPRGRPRLHKPAFAPSMHLKYSRRRQENSWSRPRHHPQRQKTCTAFPANNAVPITVSIRQTAS